jgi:hypothetical protein
VREPREETPTPPADEGEQRWLSSFFPTFHLIHVL